MERVFAAHAANASRLMFVSPQAICCCDVAASYGYLLTDCLCSQEASRHEIAAAYSGQSGVDPRARSGLDEAPDGVGAGGAGTSAVMGQSRWQMFALDWMIDARGDIHLLEGNGNPLIKSYRPYMPSLTPSIWRDLGWLLRCRFAPWYVDAKTAGGMYSGCPAEPSSRTVDPSKSIESKPLDTVPSWGLRSRFGGWQGVWLGETDLFRNGTLGAGECLCGNA